MKYVLILQEKIIINIIFCVEQNNHKHIISLNILCMTYLAYVNLKIVIGKFKLKINTQKITKFSTSHIVN